MALALRFLLAPLLVALATLAARRFGDKVGGWLSAFPFVAGPLLLILSLERGAVFAAEASRTAILGMASLAFFTLAYARLARHMSWWGALPLAWAVYVLSAWTMVGLVGNLGLRLVLAFLGLAIAWLLLPTGGAAGKGKSLAPSVDLLARMLAAAALVGTLASVASVLGSGWTGLLTPFPVATTVLVTFMHAQGGAAVVSRMLRGYLPALGALAVFFAVLAMTLVPWGVGASFGAGLLVVAVWQAALLPVLLRRPD